MNGDLALHILQGIYTMKNVLHFGYVVLIFFNERGEQVRKMWDIALDSLISVLDRNIDGVDGDFWSEFKKRYVLNQVKR